MAAFSCAYCLTALDDKARFCPNCGRSRAPAQFSAAASRIICGALMGLELLAMGLMAWIVAPRISSALLAYGGAHSTYTKLVFSPWWMPSFMVPVALLGVAAVFLAKSIPQRALLMLLALIVGVGPMVASLGGIYAVTFEEIGAVSGP